MILVLILLFPVLEIYLMIRLSDLFSFWDVVLYFVTMGFFGSLLMRFLGAGTFQQVQAQIQSGKEPSQLLLHRGLMVFGAFLIMIPGVISDFLGLLCLFPGTRHFILWFGRAYLQKKFKAGHVKFYTSGAGFGGFSRGFSNSSGAPFGVRHERDAEVIDIQALESKSEKLKDSE